MKLTGVRYLGQGDSGLVVSALLEDERVAVKFYEIGAQAETEYSVLKKLERFPSTPTAFAIGSVDSLISRLGLQWVEHPKFVDRHVRGAVVMQYMPHDELVAEPKRFFDRLHDIYHSITDEGVRIPGDLTIGKKNDDPVLIDWANSRLLDSNEVLEQRSRVPAMVDYQRAKHQK